MNDQVKSLDALVKSLDALHSSCISCQKVLNEFMNTQVQINDHLSKSIRALANEILVLHEKNAPETNSLFTQTLTALDAVLPAQTIDDVDSTRD